MEIVNESTAIKDYFEEFPSGKIKVKGKLINNRQEGEWLEYYSNGKIRRIINYQEGKKHGKATEFKDDGEIDFCLDYFHGKLVLSPKISNLLTKLKLKRF